MPFYLADDKIFNPRRGRSCPAIPILYCPIGRTKQVCHVFNFQSKTYPYLFYARHLRIAHIPMTPPVMIALMLFHSQSMAEQMTTMQTIATPSESLTFFIAMPPQICYNLSKEGLLPFPARPLTCDDASFASFACVRAFLFPFRLPFHLPF